MAIFSNPTYEVRFLDLFERLVDAVAPSEDPYDCCYECDQGYYDDDCECDLCNDEDACEYPDCECGDDECLADN